MIKTIYFDFGAVLVNYEKVFTKICADFSMETKDFWDLYNRYETDLAIGKVTTDQFWQACVSEFNLSNTENYDLVGRWVTDYEVIQPINDLIYSLANKIDIGIISNVNEGLWERSFELGLVPKINYKKIYLSYQIKMAKPNLDIYEKVQKETSVLSSEILFVDDKTENLIIPRNLGWQTVLFDMRKAEEGAAEIKRIIS